MALVVMRKGGVYIGLHEFVFAKIGIEIDTCNASHRHTPYAIAVRLPLLACLWLACPTKKASGKGTPSIGAFATKLEVFIIRAMVNLSYLLP